MIAPTFAPTSPASRFTSSPRPTRAILPLIHWLQAEPRAVLVFAHGARIEDAATPGSSTLDAELAAWRARILRRRAFSLLRRWLFGALVCAAVLAVGARLLGTAPGWPLIAAPVVLALAALPVVLYRAPSTEAIARLLDHELGLKEQVATALELAQRRSPHGGGPLAGRVEAGATAALSQARRAWSVQPAPAGREWLGLALACAVLLAAMLIPHAAVQARSTAARVSRPAVVATPALQTASYTLAVPTLPPQQAAHPVKVAIAVIRAPAPATPVAARQARQRAQALARVAMSRSANPAAQPGGKPGTSPQGKTATGGSGPTTRAANPRSGQSPTQPQRPQRNTTLPVLSNRHLFLPTNQVGQATVGGRNQPPGSGAPSRAGGPSGNSRGIAGRSLDSHGAQQTRRAANGAAGGRGGAVGNGNKIGALGRGQSRLPYGGSLPANLQLPKPGLITGKSLFSGRVPDGKNTPGSGRGSTQPAGSQALRLTRGRQMTLQSAYGANQTGQGKRGSGMGGADNGHPYAVGGAGGPGGGVIDYIPPDANSVAPDDQAVVARYFMPSPTQ